MKVSVIILNHNTFSLTSQCIASIYEHTKQTDFEIVLVDNASMECDPQKFLELFPHIKLVRNRQNRGFAGGCNDGVSQASGEYILLLNSDTLLLNDAISHTRKFLERNPGVGVATCRVENPDGTPQHNCQAFPSIPRILVELFRLHKLLPRKKQGRLLWGPWFSYTEEAYPDWVWGTFFLFPRRILADFPEARLPETFWMYGEDMEWCWLIRRAGYEVAFVPEGRVLHYGGGKNESSPAQKMMRANYYAFLYRYRGALYASIIRGLLWILECTNRWGRRTAQERRSSRQYQSEF